jgi:hypothetical protein
MTTDPPTKDAGLRWIWRGAAIAALVVGWLFIAWKNKFHVSAPMVFVCLGYLAVIATIYNLWRTGAAAVDPGEDTDSTWAKPAGALGELEREKRTLLKAIKEAEFDHQMGKLSQRDADDMIRGYRARAIEVIKEMDQLGQGGAGTVRDQILREVRARVELDAKARKPAGAARAGRRTEKAADPAEQPADTAAVPATVKAEIERALAEAVGAIGASNAGAVGASAPESARAVEVPRDEELDADSTTAIEPRRDDSAKGATP